MWLLRCLVKVTSKGQALTERNRGMNDLLVAAVFLLLVASPAIMAAMPLKDEEDRPKGLTDAIRLRLPSASRSR
jgi:hypothetical protein